MIDIRTHSLLPEHHVFLVKDGIAYPYLITPSGKWIPIELDDALKLLGKIVAVTAVKADMPKVTR